MTICFLVGVAVGAACRNSIFAGAEKVIEVVSGWVKKAKGTEF
jgi:hypothetical protein